MLKNIFRIINDYQFSLIIVIFFEFLYLVKGYKGNKFNFSKNNSMTDNIPCPYYFLFKIKNTLQKINFSNFIDFGCGSGRAINFFSQNSFSTNYIGIEYFSEQYEYCKKIFKNKKNINIVQGDFTKLDFLKYKPDCYYFNGPFKNDEDFIRFLEKIVNFSIERNIFFIFINCNKKVVEKIEKIEKINCIEKFYVSKTTGYSIFSSSSI